MNKPRPDVVLINPRSRTQVYQGLGEDHAQEGDRGEERQEQGEESVGEALRVLFTVVGHPLDEERYEDSVKDLARVHSIDEGNVGIEARLIAAKALMKLERPADAAGVVPFTVGPRPPAGGKR